MLDLLETLFAFAMELSPELLRSDAPSVRLLTRIALGLLLAAAPLLLLGILGSSGVCFFASLVFLLAFLCLILAAALVRAMHSSSDP